jgi:hypothetical protein
VAESRCRPVLAQVCGGKGRRGVFLSPAKRAARSRMAERKGFDFPPRPAELSALRIALLHSLLHSSRESLRRTMSPAKRRGRPHHCECCAFLDLIEKSPRIAWERIEDLLTFLRGFWGDPCHERAGCSRRTEIAALVVNQIGTTCHIGGQGRAGARSQPYCRDDDRAACLRPRALKPRKQKNPNVNSRHPGQAIEQGAWTTTMMVRRRALLRVHRWRSTARKLFSRLGICLISHHDGVGRAVHADRNAGDVAGLP